MSNATVSKFLLGTCLAVFVSTGFSMPALSVNAQSNNLRTNQRNRSETSNILKNVRDKDPLKAKSQKLTKNNQNQNELISKQSELEVKFSLGEKKVKVSGKNGNLNIGIPNKESFDAVDTVDDKVIYSGKNAKTDLVLESVEGGIRQIINIKDSSAPDYYDFKMDLDKDDEIVINKDGSAVVLTKDPNSKLKDMEIPKDVANKEFLEMLKKGKKVKFSIGKPWAKDANGKDLETKYTVQDRTTLRQEINLKGAAFPVVADPLWCGSQISSTKWSWNSSGNGYTLTVYPTWCGLWSAATDWYATYATAWYEVYYLTPYLGYVSSNQYASMFYQFVCHFNQIGFLKAAIPGSTQWGWNLDLWRPNVGWTNTVKNACNP